ncbi:hypothetical protein GCM10027570_12300 [Streptomonospora sediminis]
MGGGAIRPEGTGRPFAEPAGRWVRFAVRAAVAAAAGVMAAGFLDWRAGVLVAGLTGLTYVLLGIAGSGIAASARLRRALRALRGGGYRVVPDGAGRYVAVGPGGVYLVVATRRRVVRHGARGWRIGGRSAERLAERVAAQAARVDRALAAEADSAQDGDTDAGSAAVPPAGGTGRPGQDDGGLGPAPAAVALIVATGRRRGTDGTSVTAAAAGTASGNHTDGTAGADTGTGPRSGSGAAPDIGAEAVPVIGTGTVLLARPRAAARYILDRPGTLPAGQVRRLAERLERRGPPE